MLDFTFLHFLHRKEVRLMHQTSCFCKAGGTFSKLGVYEVSRSHVELFVIISVVLSSTFLGGANVHLIALVTSNRFVDPSENPGPEQRPVAQKRQMRRKM
jgi:hypothetical protein